MLFSPSETGLVLFAVEKSCADTVSTGNGGIPRNKMMGLTYACRKKILLGQVASCALGNKAHKVCLLGGIGSLLDFRPFEIVSKAILE